MRARNHPLSGSSRRLCGMRNDWLWSARPGRRMRMPRHTGHADAGGSGGDAHDRGLTAMGGG
eukprot:2372346-Prymnesium_polylepis.1